MVIAVLAVVSGPPAAWAKPVTPATDLISADSSPYRGAREHASIAAADVPAIYETVLRFYRPPGNQSRWLDRRLLADAPGDTAADLLDREFAEGLVARLGSHFCLLERPERCPRKNGAELQLSDIYVRRADEVRVVVACRLVFRHAGVMDNGNQVFILRRTSKGWRIVDRYMAERTL
jgi:hypothetical protein